MPVPLAQLAVTKPTTHHGLSREMPKLLPRCSLATQKQCYSHSALQGEHWVRGEVGAPRCPVVSYPMGSAEADSGRNTLSSPLRFLSHLWERPGIPSCL